MCLGGTDVVVVRWQQDENGKKAREETEGTSYYKTERMSTFVIKKNYVRT